MTKARLDIYMIINHRIWRRQQRIVDDDYSKVDIDFIVYNLFISPKVQAATQGYSQEISYPLEADWACSRSSLSRLRFRRVPHLTMGGATPSPNPWSSP